jgi:hypothetical protein
MKKKQNSFFVSPAVGLVFAGLLILSPKAFAAQLQPGSVKLDPDFGEKATDYILSKPLIPGSFTGKKDVDLEEIYPYFADPINKFTLALRTSGNQQYQAGDMVSTEGEINYIFDAAKAKEIAKSSTDCSSCPSSNVYRYPELNDVGVFVQVFRKDEDKIGSLEGDYLVDEFYAAQGISLSENSKEKIKVSWKIPEETKEGKYYFSLTLNTSQRFSLAGTPLLAHFPASIFDFQVNNSKNGNGAEIDKNNLAINDKSYIYRNPAPTVEPQNGEIKVTVPVSNLNTGEIKVNVKYQLYRWGQEDKADLLNTKDEAKSIGTGEKANLEYSFRPDELNSVYNLKIVAATSRSISTSNVRFVVKDHNRGIFDFIGKARDEQGIANATFCLRDAQWTGYFQGKVVLTAFDAKGKSLYKFEKEGPIEAADRCFVLRGEQYKLDGSLAVSLKGEIFNEDGQLVDQKIVNLASPIKMPPSDATVLLSPQNISALVWANKLSVLIIFLLILAGLIGYYYYYFIKNKPKKNE